MKKIENIEDLAEEFEELDEEERVEKMKEFKKQVQEGNGGDEEIDISGEFTVRVLDEDGNEKHKDSQTFKY